MLKESDQNQPVVDKEVRDTVVSHHRGETELLGSENASSDGKGNTDV